LIKYLTPSVAYHLQSAIIFQHCPVRNLHLLIGWATCCPTLLSIDGQQVAHPTFSKQIIAKVKVMASIILKAVSRYCCNNLTGHCCRILINRWDVFFRWFFKQCMEKIPKPGE